MAAASTSSRTDLFTESALDEAERRGLRLALIGRTVALVCVLAWYATFIPWPSNLKGLAIVSGFAAVGGLHYWLIATRRERGWHRYVFQTIDVAAIGMLAAFIPLSSGGEVPQIFVFRAYGVTYLFLVLAVAALSLSPGLMLWTGAMAVAALWASFGWVVSGMERTVTWSDLGPAPSTETYLSVFLDPDFIGAGTRVEESIFLLLVTGILALAVNRARSLVRERALAERRRSELSQVLGRYVPSEIVAELAANRGQLAASTRDATILFVDIAGFTGLAERKSPPEVVSILNSFFGRVSEIAARHRGVVISLIGDAALIAFNAPLENRRHAQSALDVALALQAMSSEEKFEGESLRLRIGIASGPVSAGSVGGDGRLTYTVYGDTVNIAQRLEQMNKAWGTHILATQSVIDGCGKNRLSELPGRTIPGRSGDIRIFGAGEERVDVPEASSIDAMSQADSIPDARPAG